MRWLEYAGDLEKLCCLLLLLHHAINMDHHFLTNPPLDPSRLPMHRFHRPTLLETWSQQGLMVNSMCTRGRKPLRSTPHLLGFTIDLCFWDPSYRLVVSPSCGLLRLCQDPIVYPATPSHFRRGHLVGIDPPPWAPIAMRHLCLVVAFAEGHGGGCHSGSGLGDFASTRLHQIPANTCVSNTGQVAPLTSEVGQNRILMSIPQNLDLRHTPAQCTLFHSYSEKLKLVSYKQIARN